MIFSLETYSKDFDKTNRELKAYWEMGREAARNVGIKINELVDLLHRQHPDWNVKKIAYTIAATNDGLKGFSIKTIYGHLNEDNKALLDVTHQQNSKKEQKNVLEESVFDGKQKDIEHSSTLNAREFTKQQYQRVHRNMSKSEVEKIFDEIPEDVDFEHITNSDLNAVFTKANESLINKDLEEAETRLKRFDILMKQAERTTKDQKVDKKKPEPKPNNKNIVSRKYELKYKDQTIPLICLFFYDSESFTITVDE